MVTERCELEMHSVRNACVSGMDHVYHSCLDKTAHTKTKCNEAVSTVINGGTCDVLQGNEGFLYIHTLYRVFQVTRQRIDPAYSSEQSQRGNGLENLRNFCIGF